MKRVIYFLIGILLIFANVVVESFVLLYVWNTLIAGWNSFPVMGGSAFGLVIILNVAKHRAQTPRQSKELQEIGIAEVAFYEATHTLVWSIVCGCLALAVWVCS